MKNLNGIAKTDNYPLPLMENIISLISGFIVYSKIDLKDAFHQVLVVDSCFSYTALKCNFGEFKYTTMPFGLNNAPAVFQKILTTHLAHSWVIVA